MKSSHDGLCEALEVSLDQKPSDDAPQQEKKRYSEKMSEQVALYLAGVLRDRGMDGARPSPPGVSGASGAERRIAGGIGAKKVDVTWATEEAGLLLAISVKTINFRDKRSRNYQKNLTNRRADMLFESVTLHRRFPYAVLAGLFIFDEGAAKDGTEQRNSTFLNAHRAFKLFTGRDGPGDSDERYEGFYIALSGANSFKTSFRIYHAGEPDKTLTLDELLDRLVEMVVERNSDLLDHVKGRIVKK